MKALVLISLLLAPSILMAKVNFEQPLKLQPFSLRWMNHEDPSTVYNSADYAQAVFIIEAYFKNCPYCNDNAPVIDEISAHFADTDLVQVVDVGRDCRESDYSAWIARHSPNHPVLNDCGTRVLGQLGVRGYPTTYLVDCNMNIVKSYVGYDRTGAAKRDIIRRTEALLAAGCQAE